MPRPSLPLLLLLLAAVAEVRAEGVDFQRDVRPLLERHCLDCHGPDVAESDLRLDSPLEALRGGDSGETVVAPGASGRSHLMQRVRHEDPQQRMPPESPPLSEREIDVLRAWIDDADGWRSAQQRLAAEKPTHWSFQAVRRAAAPPPPREGGPLAHPVDAFILAKLSERGLEMSRPAPRRRLIRRLYLVMHGLPPTPDQVARFVADDRPDAWTRLVDQVLSSPRYGERWAAHWLDLVRFGETHGFETNRERPHAWRYRDWVVQALNADLPYDQFVVDQLAGDATGAEPATGFLVAGPHDLVKGQDPELRLMQRQDELADIINATGTAFLGLTLGCARCHNHKFDPVSQADYYSLQAVFAGVEHADRPLPPDPERQRRLASVDQRIAALERSLARFVPAQSAPARPPVNAKRNVEQFEPTAAKFVRFTIDATSNGAPPCIDELEVYAGPRNVALASAGAVASSSGDFVHPLHKLAHVHDGKYGNAHSWIAARSSGGWVRIELAETEMIERIVWGRDREERYADRLPTQYRIESSLDGETWRTVASSADRPAAGAKPSEPAYDFTAFPAQQAEQGRRLLARLKDLRALRTGLTQPTLAYAGTFHQPGPTRRLYRGEPSAPREEVVPAAIRSLTDLELAADAPEQQRRLAVARWIASRDNPLTARVLVNRLWQHHFGTRLVATPSDFGGNGSVPSHPGLLDWLASELIDHGWSMKHIHRLLLTSRTWRQDSVPRPEAAAADAAARLLWRFPPRRLEAEGIRDCMLAVSGELDLRMGGPGFSAFEVELENVRHYFPKEEFGPEDWRRMLYMTKVRQERDAVFGVFDCPDCSQVVPQRSRSTTPLQALNLLNSRFVLQQAEFLAARLEGSHESASARIDAAYRLCFGRPPDAEETGLALEFVDAAGWREFTRALLNANEFVFIP